jgi:hypothetical protein
MGRTLLIRGQNFVLFCTQLEALSRRGSFFGVPKRRQIQKESRALRVLILFLQVLSRDVGLRFGAPLSVSLVIGSQETRPFWDSDCGEVLLVLERRDALVELWSTFASTTACISDSRTQRRGSRAGTSLSGFSDTICGLSAMTALMMIMTLMAKMMVVVFAHSARQVS